MPQIAFTPSLERFIACPCQTVQGNTVRAALDEVFAENPRLQGYILDDQGHLRQHVTIFVDGQPISDSRNLSDAVASSSEIYVLQALSGG